MADYLVKHPQSTLLAGSTEFGLAVNKQFRRPEYIVYLGNVAELRQVQDKGTSWRIGAQVPLTAVEALVAKAWPDFAELLRRFGSPPVRSVATLAGNIANGSPIGDTMPCLMALGASLWLRRGRQDALGHAGELLHRAEEERAASRRVHRGDRPAQAESWPRCSAPTRSASVSSRIFPPPAAHCATSSRTASFTEVRLAFNGLAPSPCRAPKIEAVINGRAPGAVTSGRSRSGDRCEFHRP
ncbi:MAG: FAD binding domain-containing protein [Comamonadaceae bacterium]|nr:FAD binding domain-containing protein [Comamonadaceae bacterium]